MKKIKSVAAALYLVIAAVGVASTAHATPITTPADLSPGDEYRLAFVTSTTRDATSSDIGVYNAFVTTAANNAGLGSLGTTWTAIASTASIDARVNTSTLPTSAGGSIGVPIYLLNDTKLAEHNDDLWDGSVAVALNITETGSTSTLGYVWTGTQVNGLRWTNNTLGDPGPIFGNLSYVNYFWIQHSNHSALNILQLYALSDLLTVAGGPLPEPSTLVIFALGLAGLAATRRKRRAAR